MKSNYKVHIFVVDNEPDMLEVVSIILKSAKFRCTCFTKADDCLQQLNIRNCDLLITDVKMPGKDGMELLTEVKRIVPWLPVLVMTNYGNIPMSVQAVKAGALDFIEKPVEMKTLLTAVELSLKQSYPANSLKGEPLTKSETVVLRLVLQGKSSPEIARILHRSVRTVEVHRSHIMRKFNVKNVVELVRRSTVMGLNETLQSEPI